jgi:hypothetical protein
MTNRLKNRLPDKISGISSPILTRLNGKSYGIFIRRKGVEMYEVPENTTQDDLMTHDQRIRLEKGEKPAQEWVIESTNSSKGYKVIFFNNRWYCTCPGHIAHGTNCKHIRSAIRRMRQIEAAKKAPGKKVAPKKTTKTAPKKK